MSEILPGGVRLRPAADSDSEALIALVAAAYADYPGCVLLLEEEPELLTPGSAYTPDGVWWVAERAGEILGSVALRPAERAGWGELRKLYVTRAARGQGLGAALARHAEAWAAAQGLALLHLWSDSRFVEAHRLYTRLGWTRQPMTRLLDDASRTTELEFRKTGLKA